MRLLLLNGNTDSAMSATLAAKADRALARLGARGVHVVPATARFGARYIATRATAAIAAHAVLDALAERIGRANPDRFDAAVIACFGDPGLEAAKELSPIPVVGMAEASLAIGLRTA
ncbi:MAG TPA: aspartate/glutamate racemase family protein, partial [Acetobacteraceae bacterium]|nr:aspartate/glutamate racemase family protein [Acetobacteraceae bacterium]